MPVVPQVEAAVAGHSLSGSVPVVTLAQVPVVIPVLFEVQAWQVPVQAALQHTPSAQKPLAQSLPARQVSPSAHFGQTPPQSMPVSVPLLKPFLQPHCPPLQVSPGSHVPQFSVVPQPSLNVPQLRFCAAQARV